MDDRPLFPRWINPVFVAGGILAVAAPIFLVTALMIYVRTPFHTGERDPLRQPIPFDHRHHVADDGIDCRYCHDGVEKSATAGIPPTSLCMNCHSQIWNESRFLSDVRSSYFEDRSIHYRRVYQLPDFVFFNHSIHVRKGVGCATCHGRVDRMAQIEQNQALTMGWCLNCHRNPERYLRPREEVTNMSYRPPSDQLALGEELAARYDVHTRDDCVTCHR